MKDDELLYLITHALLRIEWKAMKLKRLYDRLIALETSDRNTQIMLEMYITSIENWRKCHKIRCLFWKRRRSS